MADISVIEDSVSEINSLLEEISGKLERLKKMKNPKQTQKSDLIADMHGRIERARKALKTMRIEVREMPRVEQKPHSDKATQLEEKINLLNNDLEWIEKDQGPDGVPLAQRT
jgi:hypothetical protein